MYYILPGYGLSQSGDPFTPVLNSTTKTTREQRIYIYRQRRAGKTYKELATEVGLTSQGTISVCKRIDEKIHELKHVVSNEHKAAKRLNLNIWEYRKIYTQ
jgi:hypothetical protein